jgi:Xaa-Pro aminopeptidase
MKVVLRAVDIPDFGLPAAMPSIPAATYAHRCREALSRSGCDWLVVYADREHNANLVFLTGYDPRFEEALLLLGPNDRRILVVGNEGEGYAPVAGLSDLEVVLAQSMSLMGQDRSKHPSLAKVLRDCGLGFGDQIGIAGWKYLEREEWDEPGTGYFVPHYIVMIIEHLAGGRAALTDATAVLMHPEHGLRAIVDADQIAAHEWGAARASAALWRILAGTRVGETELAAAGRMGYAGEVLTAHVMLASGDRDAPVIGMRSPSARIMALGDGVTSAIGYWGGLSCRAGLVSDGDDAFLQAASSYFAGLLAWYETIDIGVEGGTVFESVAATLARGGLRSALNPGHLTGHDEWVHTPIRPGSTERIVSGMPFQVDIIPVPMPVGWALNCEDGVALADGSLREALNRRHPDVYSRIERRRAFMRDALGIELKDSILPLSSTPACLAPFWLKPGHLLARA